VTRRERSGRNRRGRRRPLLDASSDGRRALAIVRERAKEWDIDPAKVGVIGFSAGAFLVVDVAVDPRAAPLAFVAPIHGGEILGGEILGRAASVPARMRPRLMLLPLCEDGSHPNTSER
jgi:dienelactone hydrolase